MITGTFTRTDNGTTFESKVDQIKNHPVYKQVLADSFGGVMYNVANKYESGEVLSLWDSLTEAEQGSVGGIMKGAINFLKESN